MKLAILLVTCKDSPRLTTFTREWMLRASAQVMRYYADQSGGRAVLTIQVFDWTELSFTTEEWNAGGTTIGDRVRPEVAAARDADFAGFDRFAIVVDQADSHLAATFGTDILMAAQDFTPAILEHELGHAFGAMHTQLDAPNGPIVYGGPYCIMGFEGGKYSFDDPTLILPDAGGDVRHASSGPGMCVPSLLGTGWLDLATHAIGRSSYTDGSLSSVIRLVANGGAPPPGASGLPMCAYIDAGDRYLIEYRVPQSPWDAGVPKPGRQPAAGWIVVNRTPLNGPLQSLQVAAIPASPGESVALGPDNPYEVFKPGPLRIAVMAFDANSRTVDLSVSRRKPRSLPSGSTYGGVDVGGGGLVWTPGGGFKRVPPDSPLLNVLEQVVRLESIRSLAATGGQRYAQSLRPAAEASLASLRLATAQVDLSSNAGTLRTRLLDEVGRLQQTTDIDAEMLSELAGRLRVIAQQLPEDS